MSRKNRNQPAVNQSRRDFLWKGACAALTSASITNAISDLRLINAAAAASRSAVSTATATPYKALVCIFLFGGNDSNNMLIPTDTTTYNQYASARTLTDATTGITTTIAVPLSSLQPPARNALSPLVTDGHTYALHPSMLELGDLFNTGKMAVVANVGTLLAPITRAQYLARSVAVPAQLFSHNDQQLEWQTSVEDQPGKNGWGGRSADLLYSMNGNNNVSMNISLSGTNAFEVGNVINPYNVSSSGAISLNTSSTQQLQVLKDMIAMNHPNLYQQAFATEMNIAINDAAALNTAIAATRDSGTPTPVPWTWSTAFPNTTLGNQLKMIARLIQAAPTLGHTRQIFFASIGGFDLHSAEGASTGAHAGLLSDLSRSMNALYQATKQIGVDTQVTSFTSSDFNRTFPMNIGVGTDHGWGSHHLVVGGGVSGRKIYGTFPTLAVNGQDDTSTGRWIPTTAVDQYAATLAKWFGVSSANMSSVFPYLGRFATPDVGFMG